MAKKLPPVERERKLRAAYQDWQDGTTSAELAKRYGVTRRTIDSWVKEHFKEWNNTDFNGGKPYRADMLTGQSKRTFDLRFKGGKGQQPGEIDIQIFGFGMMRYNKLADCRDERLSAKDFFRSELSDQEKRIWDAVHSELEADGYFGLLVKGYAEIQVRKHRLFQYRNRLMREEKDGKDSVLSSIMRTDLKTAYGQFFDKNDATNGNKAVTNDSFMPSAESGTVDFDADGNGKMPAAYAFVSGKDDDAKSLEWKHSYRPIQEELRAIDKELNELNSQEFKWLQEMRKTSESDRSFKFEAKKFELKEKLAQEEITTSFAGEDFVEIVEAGMEDEETETSS